MIRSQIDAVLVECLRSRCCRAPQEPLLISNLTADDTLTNARLRPKIILVTPQKWSGAFVRRLLVSDWHGENS